MIEILEHYQEYDSGLIPLIYILILKILETQCMQAYLYSIFKCF